MRNAIIYFTFVLSTFLILPAYGQGVTVSGILKDNTNQAVIGATVSVKAAGTDSVVAGSVTDIDGNFQLNDILPGSYKLEAASLGYGDYTKNITVGNEAFNAGIIQLKESQTTLKGVTIEAKTPPVQQKDDTTQYNAASYKVNPDASAEDLIRKMPGMDLSSGSPQAQGEQVAKVLVDGKPFFGDDATSSLRNLPAEVIDKIQVYDEKSDQAQFTGFDDGNTSKTINIITKPGRRQGVFGKVYGGYGTDERYNAGGNINYFEGNRRLSLIGQTNNINIQNFAAQDLVGIAGSSGGRGGGGRGGGGPAGGGRGNASNNFQVNPQGGISKTNAVGLNYSDKWGEKIDVTASYFFNNSNNVTEQETHRNYVLPVQAGQSYSDTSNAVTNNNNHRFNMRLNYTIDSSNSLLFVPSISFQNNNSNSAVNGTTFLNGTDALNGTANNYRSDKDALNATGMLLYRHKFKKKGRTFSLWTNGGYNTNNGNSTFYSYEYFLDSTHVTDQISDSRKNGWNINSNINYTEPISRKSFLQLQYGLNYQQSESDKKTYKYVEADKSYSELDSAYSNQFTTDYITNKGGVSYRFMDSSFNFNVGLNYQYADLNNQRVLPVNFNLKRNFNNILPSAMFMYRFSPKKNLRLFYRTSTDAPSVDQLQDVINNTNPLQLSSGNPDLVQAYQHRLKIRYSATNTQNASTFFVMLSGQYTQDYIANSTIIAADKVELRDGVLLDKGGQYTLPVNMDGYTNIRSFATYGFPVSPLKSNLNINVTAAYTRTPGMINNETNYAGNTNIGLGLVLSSNISEKLDFTLSSNSNINYVRNTLSASSNNQYFNQNSRLLLNYIFWKGIVFNTELNHQLYSGLSAGYNQNFLLWNMSVAKKLFRNQQGEIRLSVYDLLKQNNSIQRTISEAYSQDVQTNVLQRYFMLTFTYNLRFFKGGASMKDVEKNERREGMMPPPDGPPFIR